MGSAPIKGSGEPWQDGATVNSVGVDGCRDGWFLVGLADDGTWRLEVHETFDELWEAHRNARVILVDVPIGLRPGGTDERRCDAEARRLLGSPRSSSVFPAPCRPALGAASYQEASRINHEASGRKLPQQSWAIAEKVAEVDELMRRDPVAREVVREVHPEVLLWALNDGEAMNHRKKRWSGFHERLEVLARVYPRAGQVVEEALERWPRRAVARDDVIDALAAAVTAKLGGPQEFDRIPPEPEVDEAGLPMQMVYIRWPPAADN